MDGQQGAFHHSSSSTSALDLSGTPTGLASGSAPPSPSLGPADATSFSRRRTSWGRVDAGQDPLRFNLNSQAGSSDSPSQPTGTFGHAPVYGHSAMGTADDPFLYPGDSPVASTFPSTAHLNREYMSTAQAGPSSASLISRDSDTVDGQREDDEAHLTQNMSSSAGQGWMQGDAEDVERTVHLTPGRSPGRTPSSRKTTVRYSVSPLQRTGSRLRNVSRNLRRVSLRVVNFAGKGLDDHIRLMDADEARGSRDDKGDEEDEDVLQGLPDLGKSMPIRGRTLGCLGPTNPIRLAMYHFLVYPLTEIVILCMIIASGVIFAIQASTNLPAVYQSTPVRGFFHQWEDYALFALFVMFTLEAFARIAVSGLLLDPEIPSSWLITSFFSYDADPSTATAASIGTSSLTRQPSLTRPHGGFSLGHSLQRLRFALRQPFSLAHRAAPLGASSSSGAMPGTPSRARSDTSASAAQAETPMLEKARAHFAGAHEHMRHPSHPTYFANLLHKDVSADITGTDGGDGARLLDLPFKLSVSRGRELTKRNMPYLRHSWNRLDLLAVMSFWVTFALAMFGVEHGASHIGIFRALSVLRTARLLAITSGTTTIMRSLKTALPLLRNVAYFVVFAIMMFSIIGVETFKGSFRRNCVLVPTLGEGEVQLSNQFCGGYIDPGTLSPTGFINANGTTGQLKGFICPLGQVCKELENPYSNSASFDTIYNAALQVVIVASANGWSPMMYDIIDSEYFVSCFFFIVAVLVLNFWLINLFVAVITNTFSAIRGDTKKSAFGAAPLGPLEEEQEDGFSIKTRKNPLKQIYESIRWCWVALALGSLVLQATRNVDMTSLHEEILDKGELVLTIAFDVEIIIRFLAELPDWRNFFKNGTNWLDLTLAIATSIIQIPVIHSSSSYPWLTAFQLLRFYRVILEFPRMKPLMLAVFGNMYGLLSMTVFLLLVNFLAALVAVQLLRPDLTSDSTINFLHLFNAFLGVYQVFSSENWTNVLYAVIQAELPLGQAVVTAIFITLWMLFANFIVLQMFIAVINENFDVAEEAKKAQQASSFWAKQQPREVRAAWTRHLNPYRWFKPNPKAIAVESLPANLVLPMQKALVQDQSLSNQGSVNFSDNAWDDDERPRTYVARFLAYLQQLFAGKQLSNDVPLATLRHNRRESVATHSGNDDEADKHLDMLALVQSDSTSSQDMKDVMLERRARKADFIREHPSYDKTFWIFSQKNIVRQACQKLVRPAGERIYGRPPSAVAHTIFQLLLLLTVLAGIVVESIATPVYRRAYFEKHGRVRTGWFDIAETTFSLTLVVEFLIKVAADGFLFTPNAYIRSIWNILDFIVLMGIVVNVTTTLIFIGGLSRLTRSLKALRALRLITLIDKMRSTFQDLLISGAVGILDAALLAILYMIPYAVWGLNIFAGLMNECNNGNATGLNNCTNEYVNSAVGSDGTAFGFLVPQVWDNPSPSTTFSFDSFRSSLLILFEIVSLEGWVDVMGVATSITGKDQQPQTNNQEVNAIFFLIYNLMGGVVILTLFVSIIIGNFKAKTGAALLTQPQREWIDLQKLIRRQKPSKRPKERPKWPVRAWCFDRAVQKHGWWSRTMTSLFFLHVVVLMTQSFGLHATQDDARNIFFLVISFVYAGDTLLRLYGLGWDSFLANGWNIFDTIVAAGSCITTVISQLNGDVGSVMQQLQKLFLVSISFKLIQRVDSLNKLFKTARASLPVILSLLALWLILFVFFSIMFLEVFGLAKWNSAETSVQNYSTMGSALVMLAFMTTGEGWNQYMHDYALEYPRCTNSTPQDSDSDCGSSGWAFTLFIAWNLLSMYIFVNMFTGVVVESFSYVFQATGGSKSITRGQMRAFKKVWAKFANSKTGHLERENFVPFFGRLSGVFEVRIYPLEYHVMNIKAAALVDDDSYLTNPKIIEGRKDERGIPCKIDLRQVERSLSSIDHASIKKRRNLFTRLYHEASVSCPASRGLTFSEMLVLLAHYKLVVDRDALVLRDLVVRTEVNRVVTDLVHLDRVRSLLKTVSYRRRYLQRRDQLHNARMEQHDIPAIVVDSLPPTPPMPSTRDITSPGLGFGGFNSDPESPTPSPRRKSGMTASDMFFTLDMSPTNLRRSRRASDVSMLSADMAEYTPRHSLALDESPQNVLSAMQSSLWGEMMLDTAEEEDH